MCPDAISSLVQRVDIRRMTSDVALLAQGQRHSLDSPVRHSETVEYISGVFREIGLAIRHHVYDLGGRRGVNIVASLGRKSAPASQGTPPLLVSAHYDTVPDSPGADDNASGVAVLLECARMLSSADLSTAIEFVAFDLEEAQPEGSGLVGSSAFVEELGGKEAYRGLYNLEMVGYTSGPGGQGHPPGFQFILPEVYENVRRRDFRGDFMAVVSQGRGIELGRRLESASRRFVEELEVVPMELSLPPAAMPDIFRSDHAPFWLAGTPAVMVTDTADFRNPHYHRPTDTPDTLDYGFMANVARALVATLAQYDDGP